MTSVGMALKKEHCALFSTLENLNSEICHGARSSIKHYVAYMVAIPAAVARIFNPRKSLSLRLGIEWNCYFREIDPFNVCLIAKTAETLIEIFIPIGTKQYLLVDGLSKTEQAYQIAVRVTRSEYERIQDLVEAGLYRSAADFAREALRSMLREVEPTSVRDVSAKEAETMIDKFLLQNPGPHFASEIAEALGLEYRTTFETIRRMLEKEKIRKSRL